MRILAIDTATDICGVALAESERPVADCRLHQKNIHNEKLIGLIQGLTERANWSLQDLDGIVLTIGPGSFTGLRIGMAVAKGLAFSLDLPLVGVNTLDVLANEAVFWTGMICTCIKARADEAYVALYKKESDRIRSYSDYRSIALGDLGALITERTLVISHPHDLVSKWSSNPNVVTGPKRPVISPSTVATMGYRKLIDGETEDLASVEPFYLTNFEPRRKTYAYGD